MSQGSLRIGKHGIPPYLSEIPPNHNVTGYVSSLYIIITNMRLAPKVILSIQAYHKISAKFTKPLKKLERTLGTTR